MEGVPLCLNGLIGISFRLSRTAGMLVLLTTNAFTDPLNYVFANAWPDKPPVYSVDRNGPSRL